MGWLCGLACNSAMEGIQVDFPLQEVEHSISRLAGSIRDSWQETLGWDNKDDNKLETLKRTV